MTRLKPKKNRQLKCNLQASFAKTFLNILYFVQLDIDLAKTEKS